MKHKIPKGGLVVVGGYVTAERSDGVRRLFQQGEFITEGWMVTECDATAAQKKAMGFDEAPKAEAKPERKGGEK